MRTSSRRLVVRCLDGLIESSANYWAATCADLLAALAFLVLGVRWFSGPIVEGVGAVILGYLSYGFLEYAVHRWVLHGPPSPARRSHAHHHAEPQLLISTPLLLITIAAVAIWALIEQVASPGVAALVLFGLYAGYDYFAVLHHWEHQHRQVLAKVSYFKRLEDGHDLHHHRPAVNFGISTTIWDRLFGTFRPS